MEDGKLNLCLRLLGEFREYCSTGGLGQVQTGQEAKGEASRRRERLDGFERGMGVLLRNARGPARAGTETFETRGLSCAAGVVPRLPTRRSVAAQVEPRRGRPDDGPALSPRGGAPRRRRGRDESNARGRPRRGRPR